MKHIIGTTALACAMAVSAATVASAQTRCAEGRTASGACVDVGLANAMRGAALIFSQPKISQTAFPLLPSLDSQYRYPHELIPTPLRPSGIGTLAPI